MSQSNLYDTFVDRRKKIDAALALYDAATHWRKQYHRTQMDPTEIRTDRDQLAYDMVLTDFGDEAFSLLMDFTSPLT